MKALADGIAEAIEAIEAHLDDDIDIDAVAAKACLSPFYFQRIFHALSGLTVGEYIRSRRLTLAAQELATGGAKVIDVALKYGDDSPDSFARAFARFHGVNPSAARAPGQRLNAVAPLKIKLTLEGGTMLEYKIVEKQPFTVMGVVRRFNSETSYAEIPEYWQEFLQSDASRTVMGMYGICLDMDGADFDYMIADGCPSPSDAPEGFVTRVIPAATWAVFPCRGALPKALQDVNTRIYSEWLPSSRSWRLAQNLSVEMYTPPTEDPDDNYCEIWIPVEKA